MSRSAAATAPTAAHLPALGGQQPWFADPTAESADAAAPVPRLTGSLAGLSAEPVVLRACAACANDDLLQRSAEPAAGPAEEDEPLRRMAEPGERDEEDAGATIQAKCAACGDGGDRETMQFAGLTVGAVDDPLETEADRAADAVMRARDGAAPGAMALSGVAVAPAPLQRQEGDGPSGEAAADPALDQELDEPAVECQAKADGTDRAQTDGAGIAGRLAARRGAGEALPPGTATFMGSAFGTDFSSVRIHRDGEAQGIARSLHAQAFTTGRDIYFAPGKYRPGSDGGDRLLAHELAHVIQQGAAPAGTVQPMIQRSCSRATGSAVDSLGGGGRGGASGTRVHAAILPVLRGSNADLITEAPLPGATRNKTGFNALGAADLYESDGNRVSGAEGEFRRVTDPAPGQPTDEPRVKAIPRTHTSRPNRGAVDGPASMVFQPDASGGAFTDTDFPSWYRVGDLKPLDAGRLAGGVMQLSNYTRGFGVFHDCAATVDPAVGTASRPSGSLLTSLTIPTELDYEGLHARNRFTVEHGRWNHGNAVVLTGSGGEHRYYVVNVGQGLFVYLHLPRNISLPASLRWVRQRHQELDGIVRGLRGTPQRGIPNSLDTKREPGAPVPQVAGVAVRPRGGESGRPQSGSAAPPASVAPHAATPRRAAVRVAPAAERPPAVQRTPTDWSRAGREWEQRRRRPWARQVRQYLRRDPQGEAFDAKMQADRQLADLGKTLPARSRLGTDRDTQREYRRLDFWSSGWGKFFGAIRFRMGGLFDRVAEKADRVREKFKRFRQRARTAGGRSFGFGWRKTLISVLLRAAAEGFSQLVQLTWQVMADCLTGIMNGVIAKITDEASEALKEQICKLERAFDDLQARMEEILGARIDEYETLLQRLGDAQYWIGLASGAVDLIRLGFQAVACLSPPAVGCLWGLVGQLAIEVMLDLIIDTEWFRANIARPAVSDLLRRYVGPRYVRMLDGLITDMDERFGTDIASIKGNVQACEVEVTTDGAGMRYSGGGSGGVINFGLSQGLTGRQLRSHRSQWEQEHAAELQAFLGDNFQTTGGRTPTARELRDLLQAIRDADLTPEQIAEKLERARTGDGRVNVDLASLGVTVESALAPLESAGMPGSPDQGGTPPPRDPDVGAFPGTGQTPEAAPVHRAHRPTPGRSYTHGNAGFFILDGMTAGGTYEVGTAYPVMIEVQLGDERHLVTGVSLVFRGVLDPTPDGDTVFQVEFEEPWAVDALDLGVDTVINRRYVFPKDDSARSGAEGGSR